MPSISDTRIANMALGHVGTRSNIESLADEVSTEANACRLWYDYSRVQTLEAFDWNFARVRAVLTTHGEDPPDGVWGFRYVYPGDCVSARKLENPTGTVAGQTGVWVSNFSTPAIRGDAIAFEIELNSAGTQKTILTDLSDATLVYTFEQKSMNLWSPLGIEALALALASHIAFTLTGKIKLSQNLALTFQYMMLLAPANNANEMVDKPPRDSDWVRGRI